MYDNNTQNQQKVKSSSPYNYPRKSSTKETNSNKNFSRTTSGDEYMIIDTTALDKS